MKIYAISGLGADKRVYQQLTLDYELIHINWINPNRNEAIDTYAQRLSETIDQNEPFGLIGLSFGGIIATEISKQLKPQFTILISSAATKFELRKIYRWFGKTKLIYLIPKFCFNMPKFIAYYLFGAKNKKLLSAILDDADSYFTKWAVSQIIIWKNTTVLNNCTKISGTKDKLLPPKDLINTILVENGEHFMIVDRSAELSLLINKQLHDRIRTVH